jgi:hypothetical protein
MTHPGPLLIDYVDGTLEDAVCATVDAHLRTCAACREEVSVARAGKRAAASLPTPEAPVGARDAAIAEAARIAGRRHPEIAAISSTARWRPNTQRWVGLATAAAVIVVIAVIAPRLGAGDSMHLAQHTEAAAGAASSAPVAGPTSATPDVVAQDKDYSSEDLSDAARAAQQSLVTSTSDQAFAAAANWDSTLFSGAPTNDATVAQASRCLQQAFESARGNLARVLLARYNGQRAYFGIYLVSPGHSSGELRIDVASVEGCAILAQSSAKL